jgi:hypothetical protein
MKGASYLKKMASRLGMPSPPANNTQGFSTNLEKNQK